MKPKLGRPPITDPKGVSLHFYVTVATNDELQRVMKAAKKGRSETMRLALEAYLGITRRNKIEK